MTPEELAANSAAIQQALTDIGITPEKALLAEGRQKAWARFERAYKAAETNAARRAAIEARVERDATTHMRREMARERAPNVRVPSYIAPDGRQVMGEPPTSAFPTLAGDPRQPAVSRADEIAPVSGLGLDYGNLGMPSPPRPTASNALMPQSMGEELDLRGQTRGLMDAAGVGLSMTPIGRGVQMVGRGAQAAGRVLSALTTPAARTAAAHPLTTGGVIAGATTLATPGQTSDAPPLPASGVPAARASLSQVEAAQQELAQRRANLDKLYNQFGSIPSNNRQPDDRVKRLQEFLNSPAGGAAGLAVDGINKGKTNEALKRWLARTEQERASLAREAQALAARWNAANKAVTDADAADAIAIGNRRQQEIGQPTFLENYGNVLGFTGGALVGAAESLGAGRAVRALEAGRLGRANRLLGEMGTGTPTERAARVNQFWTEGGARAPMSPFAYDANRRPYPFYANNAAADASRLYQPRSAEVFAPGAIIAAKGLGESGVAYSQLEDAHKELQAAQEALRQRPNDESRIQAVLAARNKVASLETAIRFGAGETVGAFGETLISRFTHKPPRPDVFRAERERADVDLLLNPPAPQPPNNPPPPPLGPNWEGQNQVWQGPNGERLIRSGPNRWHAPAGNRRGGRFRSGPPPGWQRISEADRSGNAMLS